MFVAVEIDRICECTKFGSGLQEKGNGRKIMAPFTGERPGAVYFF